MNEITKAQATRLVEISNEMNQMLEEFKRICRNTMYPAQYDQFKYRTLGHLEPALFEDSEWYAKYSSIDSLEKVANNLMEEVNEDDSDEDEDCDEEDHDDK